MLTLTSQSNEVRDVRDDVPRLNGYTLISCLVAAIGSLLYGMDFGIGGVLAMPSFLQKFFPDAYAAKKEHENIIDGSSYCLFRSGSLSIFASSYFLSGMLSSLLGMWVTSKYGRRITIRLGAVCTMLGSIIAASSEHTATLFLSRVFVGFGFGFASQSVPVYISELSPPASRGAVLSCFGLFLGIGLILGGSIEYFAKRYDYGWRISLGASAPLALCLLIGSYLIPETPAYLSSIDDHDKARATLQRLRGPNANIEHELEKIEHDTLQAKKYGNQWQQLRILMTRPYRGELTVAASIAAFSRLTGMNAIIFFAPQLFASADGGARESVFLKALIVYFAYAAGSLFAVLTIDRFGRKTILISGAISFVFLQVSTAIVLRYTFDPYNPGATSQSASNALLSLISASAFIFGWSWTPIGWTMPTECQSQATRSAGACIGVVSNVTMIFLTFEMFFFVLCSMEWGTFLLFAGFDLIMIPFVWMFVVETKGVSIAEVRKEFQAHRYWKAYAGQKEVEEFSES